MFGASLPGNAVSVEQIRTGAEGVAEVTAEIQADIQSAASRWTLAFERDQNRPGHVGTTRNNLARAGVTLPAGNCDDPSLFVETQRRMRSQ